MARSRASQGDTKWMIASYALPGAALVLALLVFASMGYPFAARLLVMVAAMLMGMGTWYLAPRSSRRTFSVGLVGAVHLIVVVGFPALALTAYPDWMQDEKYAGLTFGTVPAAIWNGVSFSFVHGVWFTVVGSRRERTPADRDVPF